MSAQHQTELAQLLRRLREGRISRRAFLQRASALVAAGSLPAGAAFAEDSAPRKGGFARFGVEDASQNDTLDPGTWATVFTGGAFNGALCNNLTEILADGSVAGDLAESWESDAAAKRWIFTLRPGVTFHDGRDLTVEDVRQSLFFHMGEDSTSGALPIVSQIEDIQADGARQVVFTLKEGSADFPYLVADYHLSVFPALEGGGIDWQGGVGTGAFVMESFEPGIAVKMTRNPNYHKDNKPYLDEVEFIGIADPTARLNALLTGEIEFMTDIDVRNLPLIERSSEFRIQRTPSLRHFTFDMNASVAPFDDPDVRLALKYAMDRDDIIQKVFLGDAVKGNDQPVSRIMEYFKDPVPPHDYSVAKAKEHLAKAGLTALTVDLSVSEIAFPGAVEAAVLYKEHAAAAGITINVVREANDGYWDNVWLKKPFNACDWYGRPTCDWLFKTSYTGNAPWNNTGWSNPRFEELLAAAAAETDTGTRAAQYAEMQQILHDDGGVLLVAFFNWRNALSNRLRHGQVGGLFPADNHRMAERWWMVS